MPFWEQQHTHGSCYISLFKFNSFDQFITPQIASNFRHLLSCGTIVTFGTHRASREGQTSRVACLAFNFYSNFEDCAERIRVKARLPVSGTTGYLEKLPL